jgi:hypothetical protein
MNCHEPHPAPNEKTQPIQWIERPTGALVAVNSFWPIGPGPKTGKKRDSEKRDLEKRDGARVEVRTTGAGQKRDSAFKPIGLGPAKTGSSLSVLCSCNSRAISACMYAPRWRIVFDHHGHPLVIYILTSINSLSPSVGGSVTELGCKSVRPGPACYSRWVCDRAGPLLPDLHMGFFFLSCFRVWERSAVLGSRRNANGASSSCRVLRFGSVV